MTYFRLLFIFLLLLVTNLNASTKFLIFGDFGTGDAHQKLVADDMQKYCKTKGCDFAVTVGDNIYPRGVENLLDGKTDYDKGTPNYQIISDYFVKNYQDLNMPFYMSFGNHDVGNEGVVSIFKDLFKNQEGINKRTVNLMLNQINYTKNPSNPVVMNSQGVPSRLWNFRAPFYHLAEKEGVNLWAINTNTYPHQLLKENNELDVENPNNRRQEQWLKNSLIGNTQAPWKIVFGHMPLYSHGKHGYEDFLAIKEFRESILGLLCEQKVDFYLAGHDHHLEVDRHVCSNGHVIIAVISGAAAKSDRIYGRSFPIFSNEENLLWGNGKFYKNNKQIYKADDKVLGFAHLSIDGLRAVLHMRLSQGASIDRTDACFEIIKDKGINNISCAKTGP